MPGRTRRRALWLALAFAVPLPILFLGDGLVPAAKLAVLALAAAAVMVVESARGAVPLFVLIVGLQTLAYLAVLWLVAWAVVRWTPAWLGWAATAVLGSVAGIVWTQDLDALGRDLPSEASATSGALAWVLDWYRDPYRPMEPAATTFPEQARAPRAEFDPGAWHPAPRSEPGLPFARSEWREPCDHFDPLRQPFFGDTHVHTSYSFDAWGQGTRNSPRDAYRFARGEALGIQPYDAQGQPGRSVQLRRPLDFTLISDHAEMLGEVRICQTPGMPGHDAFMCRLARRWPLLGYVIVNSQMMDDSDPVRYGFCGKDGRACRDAARIPWQEIQEAAEEAYDRSSACRFTSFVGFEWSGNPDSSMIHRNVLFRNEVAPQELSNYVDDRTGEALWAWLRASCLEAGGRCDALVIPHNSNLSNGRLFGLETEDGNPLTREYAELRSRLEPLLEVTQHKGDSECRAPEPDGAGDPLCDFEKLPFARMREQATPWQQTPPPHMSYAREILAEGLVQHRQLGANPFKLGLIGASDTHLGTPGLVDEAEFPGHAAGMASARLEVPPLPDDVLLNPGGLQGVWAEENSRDALFAAMRRRETWGTSGPRIVVRSFAGFDLPGSPWPADLCERGDFAARGYAAGVPMGGDLASAPPGAGLAVAVLAQRDPGFADRPGTALQRIQIVKLWERDGVAHEAVIDVAGDPANGASVDLATCEPQGGGFDSLCAVWRDTDFDPGDHALYYARVVENPTCRWTTWACNARGVSCDDPSTYDGELAACCASDVPRTLQERAWTSPVWYTP